MLEPQAFQAVNPEQSAYSAWWEDAIAQRMHASLRAGGAEEATGARAGRVAKGDDG